MVNQLTRVLRASPLYAWRRSRREGVTRGRGWCTGIIPVSLAPAGFGSGRHRLGECRAGRAPGCSFPRGGRCADVEGVSPVPGFVRRRHRQVAKAAGEPVVDVASKPILVGSALMKPTRTHTQGLDTHHRRLQAPKRVHGEPQEITPPFRSSDVSLLWVDGEAQVRANRVHSSDRPAKQMPGARHDQEVIGVSGVVETTMLHQRLHCLVERAKVVGAEQM